MTRRGWTILFAIALPLISVVSGCTPDKALDFGPTGEITTPPEDQLSRDIMRDFAGRDFILGNNDHEAHIRLADWKPGRGIVMPYWLGVNQLYPGFLRPTVGHLYVISQSTLVRPLGNNEYLIRAAQKLFKSDTVFEATHTHYTDTGGDAARGSPLRRHPRNNSPQRCPSNRNNHRKSPSPPRSLNAHAHNPRPGPDGLRQVRADRSQRLSNSPLEVAR